MLLEGPEFRRTRDSIMFAFLSLLPRQQSLRYILVRQLEEQPSTLCLIIVYNFVARHVKTQTSSSHKPPNPSVSFLFGREPREYLSNEEPCCTLRMSTYEVDTKTFRKPESTLQPGGKEKRKLSVPDAPYPIDRVDGLPVASLRDRGGDMVRECGRYHD